MNKLIMIGLWLAVFMTCIPVLGIEDSKDNPSLPSTQTLIFSPKINVVGATTLCGVQEWEGVQLVVTVDSALIDDFFYPYIKPYAGYRWYKDGELLPGKQDSILIIKETGRYSVDVFVQKIDINLNNVSFNLDTLLRIRSADDKPLAEWLVPFPVPGICRGETATIGIEPVENVEYCWRKEGEVLDTVTSNTMVIQEAGLYEVNIWNACGESPQWQKFQMEELTPPPLPVIDSLFLPCGEGEAYVSLEEYPGLAAGWWDEDGELLSDGDVHELHYPLADQARIYTRYRDGNGCRSEILPVDLEIREVQPIRIGHFLMNYVDCLELEPEDVPVDGSFSWLPDDGCLNDRHLRAPLFCPQEKRDYRYTLEYEAPNGCLSKDSADIRVLFSYQIPEIITPNGDGYNDFWVIDWLVGFPDHKVMIFDRRGKQLFSASPYGNDWDGHSDKGELLPSGTYFYEVTGIGKEPLRGMVSIIRN